MAATRTPPAASRPLRIRRAAVLAVAGACWVSLRSVSSAFAPALQQRPAVLDNPASAEADARTLARLAEELDGRRKRKEDLKKSNATATLQNDFNLQATFPRNPVSVEPSWATCFVESAANGDTVLEEWTMRGEHENVEAFRSWRQEAFAGDGHVRCEDTTSKAADEVMCLECLAQTDSSHSRSVAMVEATIVSTFVDVQQCLSSTVGGKGFCKSGQVSLPR
mmetsp:Transcript_69252/g.149409  ORF Transcript_69252/g.149409 Transcript_69252/m.149409 type:complete len:222 (+) Transcript_69252:79-744(+)